MGHDGEFGECPHRFGVALGHSQGGGIQQLDCGGPGRHELDERSGRELERIEDQEGGCDTRLDGKGTECRLGHEAESALAPDEKMKEHVDGPLEVDE